VRRDRRDYIGLVSTGQGYGHLLRVCPLPYHPRLSDQDKVNGHFFEAEKDRWRGSQALLSEVPDSGDYKSPGYPVGF